MIMRVNAMRRRVDRMLNDLCNERRIMWRILEMDRTMIGHYLRWFWIIDIINRIDRNRR